jgi:hypothetical protein
VTDKIIAQAIADANKAIDLDPNNSKAYLRKGIACFNMEEYATAKTAFEKGRELDDKNAQFKTWIRKCNAEIEDEMASEMAAPAAATPAPAAAAVFQAPPPKPVQRFRHDFIQTPTHVTVTFYMKGATKVCAKEKGYSCSSQICTASVFAPFSIVICLSIVSCVCACARVFVLQYQPLAGNM